MIQLIEYQSMMALPAVAPHAAIFIPAPVRMQVVSSSSRQSRRGPVAPTAIVNYDPSQPCDVTEDGEDCLSHGPTCETLKVFQCPRCTYKAKQAWNLQRHLKYHDKGRWVRGQMRYRSMCVVVGCIASYRNAICKSAPYCC